MPPGLRNLDQVWIVVCGPFDPTGQPLPSYLAAMAAFREGDILCVCRARLRDHMHAPYPTGSRALIITLDAGSLVRLHLRLHWQVPLRIIDLLVEDRVATNGERIPMGPHLTGALWRHGLPTLAARRLDATVERITGRLNAIVELFRAMLPALDVGRALLRGRYLVAVARMEATGVPVDVTTAERLQHDWPRLREQVPGIVDRDFGLLEGGQLHPDRFETWLAHRSIEWPRSPSGGLCWDDETFRDMARAHHEIGLLRELRALADFEPQALALDPDARNRVPLRPFSTRTGRNAPSAKASVMGQAAWVRHLVRPAPGMGLALIDWCQQEFGIAAALSGDTAMQKAYAAGDPYLAFAVMAGAAPADATAATHGTIRTRYKACALGLQYGMGPAKLSRLTGQSEPLARDLQLRHKAAFPIFWRWSDAVEARALLLGELSSVFGWRIRVGADANPRMLRNFPLQANGAEMLRLACCLATEAGIRVCLPLHDALLIEAPLPDLDNAVRATQQYMAEASDIVLDGFALRTDVKTVRHPERYSDPRGAVVWRALEEALAERPSDHTEPSPAHERDASCAWENPRPISLYVSHRDGSDGTD
jgi:DNA polymerase I